MKRLSLRRVLIFQKAFEDDAKGKVKARSGAATVGPKPLWKLGGAFNNYQQLNGVYSWVLVTSQISVDPDDDRVRKLSQETKEQSQETTYESGIRARKQE